MEVYNSNFTKKTNILNSNLQILRLSRNQKDIAQFFGKLCSYRSEPKTYEQFAQLNALKDKARELRDSNKAIASILRNEPNATVRCSRLLNTHLQKFEVFTKEVLSYLGDARLRRASS